ncbi:MAG: alcohol dehydrogenase [Phycisphaeraceae bacterium]|nr:MAG: alcohol dehydrogenase [Phycisphaeraceae bacterium]
MRALRFDGKSVVFDAKSSAPKPGAGEALLRPTMVGISSIDVMIARGAGPLGPFTGVMGHEFVAVVEDAGEGASGVKAGSRVVGSIIAMCGKCDMCRSGLGAHCREKTVPGVQGRDGCFAERFTLPAACLCEVPDSLEDDVAIFAEPLSCALQAQQQIRVEGKPYITVLGDGPLGLLAAQAMTHLNASVRLLGRHEEKLDKCERWGIQHRHVNDVGRRADQDVVVDCTGTTEGLTLAMRLVRPRGVIVLKSLGLGVEDGKGVDLTPLVEGEIQLLGSRTGPIREAVAMLERSDVVVEGLVTKRMRLEDGAKAIAAAGESGQIKVVMEV